MLSELLSAAVSGQLADQDSAAEPASELLPRLGRPPSDADAETLLGEEDLGFDTVPSSPPNEGDAQLVSLARILHAAGPLRVADLYSRAGFDVNDTGAIEAFYLTLRDELGKSIRVREGSDEQAVLEAVPDAPG